VSQRDTSRKRILETAREHFLERAYDGATLREIASAADVTTGSLYHHFSGKDELFVEVCVEGIRSLLRRIQTAVQLSDGRPLVERMAAVFDAYAAFFIEERGYYELIERLEHSREQLAIRADLARRVETVSREIVESLVAMIQEARPHLGEHASTERALCLVALAEGMFSCERRGLLSRFGLSLGAFRTAMLQPAAQLLGE
jgi:TetR/AcrR family transcriptional regulator